MRGDVGGVCVSFFFLMIRRPPRSTLDRSSGASDVYKRQLYYSPGACSLAPHIVLEEAKAPYTTQRVDLKGGEQRSPEYLKVNPKGRVPALATERGILTENPAILGY